MPAAISMQQNKSKPKQVAGRKKINQKLKIYRKIRRYPVHFIRLFSITDIGFNH